MKHSIITDVEYYSNERFKLRNVSCPQCRLKGGLFRGFYSVGCFYCLGYFDEEQVMIGTFKHIYNSGDSSPDSST